MFVSAIEITDLNPGRRVAEVIQETILEEKITQVATPAIATKFKAPARFARNHVTFFNNAGIFNLAKDNWVKTPSGYYVTKTASDTGSWGALLPGSIATTEKSDPAFDPFYQKAPLEIKTDAQTRFMYVVMAIGLIFALGGIGAMLGLHLGMGTKIIGGAGFIGLTGLSVGGPLFAVTYNAFRSHRAFLRAQLEN